MLPSIVFLTGLSCIESARFRAFSCSLSGGWRYDSSRMRSCLHSPIPDLKPQKIDSALVESVLVFRPHFHRRQRGHKYLARQHLQTAFRFWRLLTERVVEWEIALESEVIRLLALGNDQGAIVELLLRTEVSNLIKD